MLKVIKQPIDRVALLVILILSLVILGLVFGSKLYGSGPKIKDFSWQSKEVGSEDIAFIVTFDRQMKHESVTENIKITPPLAGKFSWAGRRMAFTLDNPIPYGENYSFTVEGASDLQGRKMQPYHALFKSRDRAFAYIGVQGQERGRLILYNITQKRKEIITPADLEVAQFKFYSSGDSIALEATEKNKGISDLRNLKLYRLDLNQDTQKKPTLELLLDSGNFQNNDFDLSQDGETIVIERVNRSNATNYGLWVLKLGMPPQPLQASGGQFLIAPDSQTLAIAQGEGIGLLPLTKDAKPLDFLPQFGQILNFARDGRSAVFINFNRDRKDLSYLRSLYYVNKSGISKELLRLAGSILNCQFNPQATSLYCLLTKETLGQRAKETPYFVKIDVDSAKTIPLITLPEYQDIGLSLSPDGLAILFDQVVTDESNSLKDTMLTNAGEHIQSSSLWLLIPPLDLAGSAQLQELPIKGLRPQWRP